MCDEIGLYFLGGTLFSFLPETFILQLFPNKVGL